jgi:hypothetical protein
MHVKHSLHIKRPVQDVSSALLASPSKLFPRSVGLHIAGIPVQKRVHLLIGEPERTSTWAAIPIWWQPTSGRMLFPVMNGKVEVAPSGKDETRLTVSGMYEPPLGKLGEELDKAVMHRVAEGTVKELAEVIAKKLGD